jgi:hypothetical protein
MVRMALISAYCAFNHVSWLRIPAEESGEFVAGILGSKVILETGMEDSLSAIPVLRFMILTHPM